MNDTPPLPEIDVEVDAVGLTCPMPLLKAKRALNAMASGQHLRVLATDPGSVRDFEVFSEQSGHPLLVSAVDGDRFVHVLRKA
jgi:TusA-related sulfurtransferase